jgi:hypothetical protein
MVFFPYKSCKDRGFPVGMVGRVNSGRNSVCIIADILNSLRVQAVFRFKTALAIEDIVSWNYHSCSQYTVLWRTCLVLSMSLEEIGHDIGKWA